MKNHGTFWIWLAILVLSMIMLLMGMSNGSSVTMTLGGLFTLTAVGMYIGMSVKTGKWNPWNWDTEPCDAEHIASDVNPLGAKTFKVHDGDCVIDSCADGYTLESDFLSCKAKKGSHPN